MSSTTNGAVETATFTYDGDGNAVSKTLSRSGENGANKVLTTVYEYNAVNALTGERITDRNGAVVAEYAYTVAGRASAWERARAAGTEPGR